MKNANMYFDNTQVTIILDKESQALIPFTPPQLDLICQLFEGVEVYKTRDGSLVGYIPNTAQAVLFYSRPITSSIYGYTVVKLWPPESGHRVYLPVTNGDIAYNTSCVIAEPPRENPPVTAVFLTPTELPAYLATGSVTVKDARTIPLLVEVIKRAADASTSVISTITKSAVLARSYASKVDFKDMVNILSDIR